MNFQKIYNKKGTLAEMAVFLILLIVIVAVGYVMIQIWNDVTDDQDFLDMVSDDEGNETLQMVNRVGNTVDNSIDITIFLFFLALLLTSVTLAYLSRNHSIFKWANILMLIILLIIAPEVANILDVVTSDEGFATADSLSPFTGFLIDNLVIIIFVFALVLLMVQFLQPKEEVGA